MSRSAFLPEDGVLTALLSKAKAPIAEAKTSSPPPPQPARSPSDSESSSGITASFSSPLAGHTSWENGETEAEDASSEQGLRILDAALASCDSLEDRFTAVTSWLRHRTGATRILIVDEEGLSLTSDRADQAYEAAAGDLGSRLKSTLALLPDVAESSARLKMRAGEHLELIWCETQVGRLAVGAVSTNPLPPSWAALVPRALQRAVET